MWTEQPRLAHVRANTPCSAVHWPMFRLTPPVALFTGPCSGCEYPLWHCSRAPVQAVNTPCSAVHGPMFSLWIPSITLFTGGVQAVNIPCSTSQRDSLVAATV